MTTRSNAKAERAKNDVQQYLADKSITNPGEIYALTLDLNDFDSVKSFPNRYERLFDDNGTTPRKIDVLMNNAGAKYDDHREVTRDGYERTFQSNHLGPFLFTSLLFPYLNRESDGGARIINLTSVAHTYAKDHNTNKPGLDMTNLNSELSYSAWEAYDRSKLENILFTQELQRRSDAAGLDWLSVVALHPGIVGTDIWRNEYFARTTTTSGGGVLQAAASKLFYNNVALTTEEGAYTQVMLAASEKKYVDKGKYYDEYGRVKELAPFARDEVKAKMLWEHSEKFAG